MADGTEEPRIKDHMMIPPSVRETIGTAIRGQYWPTVPLQYGSKDVLTLIRFYSCGLSITDARNVFNADVTLPVKFSLPCIVAAVTGTCVTSDGSGIPQGWKPNDCYKIMLEAGSGAERITVTKRRASLVVGTAERPGFLGGGGWIFPAGSSLEVTLTPSLPGLAAGVNTEIELAFHCLEFRSGQSYPLPRGG